MHESLLVNEPGEISYLLFINSTGNIGILSSNCSSGDSKSEVTPHNTPTHYHPSPPHEAYPPHTIRYDLQT